jgi:hypothetical protein
MAKKKREPYNNPKVESQVAELEARFRRGFENIRRYLTAELATLEREGQVIKSTRFNVARMREIVRVLRARMRGIGFGDIIAAVTDGLGTLINDVLGEGEDHGLDKKFEAETGQSIDALIWGVQRQIVGSEAAAANTLEDLLMRSVLGGVKWGDLIAKLRDELNLTERQARIKASETIASFHTQVRRQYFEDAGIEWFLYAGPKDDRNRDFCRAFVDTRVTKALLDEYATDFGRKHPLPPSISLGGYNCRHELIPLVTAKARARHEKGPR